MSIVTPIVLGTSPNAITLDIKNVETARHAAFGRDNSRITVAYKLPWADTYKARRLLLGETTRKLFGATPYLSRDPLPHQWIETEARNLYATAITGVEGIGSTTQPDCYDEVMMTVNYEQLPFDVRPDTDADIIADVGFPDAAPDESKLLRWVEFGDRHSTGRLIKAYAAGLVFCNSAVAGVPNPALGAYAPDDKRPVMNGALMPIYEDTIPLVWHQVPLEYAPLQAAADMQNKMNSVAFVIGNVTYPIYTLLFMGVRLVRTRLPQTWDGTFPDLTRAVNLQYEFKYQREGWDAMPDALKTMGWYRVRGLREPTRKMLGEDDFKKLFRPT